MCWSNAFNIPSNIFQSSTGFQWIEFISHNSLNFWFGLVFNHCAILKALGLYYVRYLMLNIHPGMKQRCENLSDRRRFAYFQGDFMATTEVDLALRRAIGWCWVFIVYNSFIYLCHRVPYSTRTLPSYVLPAFTNPEGFATDATTLRQPPRSTAKRQCVASFTEENPWVPISKVAFLKRPAV